MIGKALRILLIVTLLLSNLSYSGQAESFNTMDGFTIITSSETWSRSTAISDILIVAPDAVITIESGVTIDFNADLIIYGKVQNSGVINMNGHDIYANSVIMWGAQMYGDPDYPNNGVLNPVGSTRGVGTLSVNADDYPPPPISYDLPSNHEVTAESITLTGRTVPNVKVKIGSSEGVARADGTFTIPLILQEGVNVMNVSATNVFNREIALPQLSITVVPDTFPPAAPVVSEVNDTATSVTGTAEADSTIHVNIGSSVIGTGATDGNGRFIVQIPRQKAGAVLSVTSTDKAGNSSESTTVTVKDVTPPAVPAVNEVTDQSTSVKGNTEAAATVTVKNGTALLGTGTANSEGGFMVNIPQQKAGTSLTVFATDTSGNKGQALTVSVKDVTAPKSPIVNKVTDQSVSVTGTTESGGSVAIKSGTTLLGKGTADAAGAFSISIPKQKVGTPLTVTAADTAGNMSDAVSITVSDGASPARPVVNPITEQSTQVTGMAEAGSVIKVKASESVIGSGITAADGTFSVSIPKQTSMTLLTVTATDKAGNESIPASVEVVDNTAPKAPVIQSVTDQSTKIEGEAEANATFEALIDDQIIREGFVDSYGKFSIPVTKPKAGSEVKVRTWDRAGNSSEATVIVQDVTAPAVPVVKPVTDQSTAVTGSAEPGSTVKILKGPTIIGTAKAAVDRAFHITIPKQSKGTELLILATDAAGNISNSVSVLVTDGTPPAKPMINPVADADAEITGKAEPGSYILARTIEGNLYSTYTLDDGTFSMRPAIMPGAGTVITFTAKDEAGNISEVVTMTVTDKTAPRLTDVNSITDQSTSISGQTEPNATVTAVAGTQQFGPEKADGSGNFSLAIPKLSQGTSVILTAIDKAGNISEASYLTVKDGTPPAAPTAVAETWGYTLISGSAERNSRIIVRSAGITIGTGYSNYDGSFRMEVPFQQAGSMLALTVYDGNGNSSDPTEVIVTEAIIPAAPTAQEITNRSTTITGASAPGTFIRVVTEDGVSIGHSELIGSEGTYKLNISKQPTGAEISIYAVGERGWKSDPAILTVKASQPPKPTVFNVTDQSTTVTGRSEEGNRIEISVRGTVIGKGIATATGSFTITIPKQKGLTELEIVAIDRNGQRSEVAVIKVIDTIPPAKPIIDPVNISTTVVTGTAEPGSSIFLMDGQTYEFTGSTDSTGRFEVRITGQEYKDQMIVQVIDASGNKGEFTGVWVGSWTPPYTKRLAGSTRYGTAAAISKEGWRSSDAIVIATGTDFPDALAGGPLAFHLNAPILLTKKDDLPDETVAEIKRLGASKAVVLGSTGAVSGTVEAQLESLGLSVERIGGKTRYETAALIAKRIPSKKAVIAYGSNFPDVLAVSPYASQHGLPILLTQKDRIPEETKAALAGKTSTIVVGSTGVVSDAVFRQLPSPKRYGGKTRFDTARAIVSGLRIDDTKGYVATGRNFPDALTGAVLAAKQNAPILLVEKEGIPDEMIGTVDDFLFFEIFGSTGAVNKKVQDQLYSISK